MEWSHFLALTVCVFSNGNEGGNSKMPLHKFKLDSICGKFKHPLWRLSHIYAFPLNLISCPFKNSHRIPTDPWGFIAVPIPNPYPYPWESPYPR